MNRYNIRYILNIKKRSHLYEDHLISIYLSIFNFLIVNIDG